MARSIGSQFSILDCYGGLESVDACFIDQHFSKHVHEGYAIGVITQGAQRFYHAGCYHLSGQGSLVLLNADSMHTGESAHAAGWRYRAIYPTPEWIARVFADLPALGACAPYFRQPVIESVVLQQQLLMIFAYADRHATQLVLESLLLNFFIQLIGQCGRVRFTLANDSTGCHLNRVRDYLDEYAHLNLSLDCLAAIAGVNKYILIRQFKAKWGLAPHQYQIQRRVQKAKALLGQGAFVADVALDCGFYDQSHLAGHFKKALGTTPNQYRQGMRLSG